MTRDAESVWEIHTPLTDELLSCLHAGDRVLITGTVYVARDAAHERMVATLAHGRPLPFDPKGQVIYYMGPTPARPGKPIGSAGPTTSCRMDPYTERLVEAGVKGMIGKGNRSLAIREALRRFRAVYFAAVGGVAALIAQCIREAKVIAYDDLGPEALRRLWVERFPVIVADDIYGGDVYELGARCYRRS